MKVERVPIDSVGFDPANARRHPERNLETIKCSLRRFGQQKPIVVDGAGVVRAGNGTLAAAKDLGWTEIDVVRTSLKGTEATAFAIADNRTAELAEWDAEVLAGALSDPDLGDVGFSEEEIAKLTDGDGGGAAAAAAILDQFKIVVTCRDEQHQTELLGKFAEQGIECTALVA